MTTDTTQMVDLALAQAACDSWRTAYEAQRALADFHCADAAWHRERLEMVEQKYKVLCEQERQMYLKWVGAETLLAALTVEDA